MATYNGYPSWNAWNVSLWINNDEGFYRYARDLAERYGVGNASQMIAEEMRGKRTPDGAPFSLRSVKLALRGIID